jgi:hypothetical protein
MKVWNGTGSRGGTGRVVVVDGDESWLRCFSNSFTIKLLGQSVCVTIRWLLLLFFVFQTGCASKRCSVPARIDDILLVLFLSCVLNRTRDGIHLSSKQQCVYSMSLLRIRARDCSFGASDRPSFVREKKTSINRMPCIRRDDVKMYVMYSTSLFVQRTDGRSVSVAQSRSHTVAKLSSEVQPTDA